MQQYVLVVVAVGQIVQLVEIDYHLDLQELEHLEEQQA
jgi:hypothetical protein